MGYDITQFVDSNRISRNLICSICTDVLNDPIQIDKCEHVYCRLCIETWFGVRKTCPQDQTNITPSNLRPAPRYLRNMIQELEIMCKNAVKGCEVITTVEGLNAHLKVCDFDLFDCEKCGGNFKTAEKFNHDCIRYLLSEVAKHKSEKETIENDLKSKLEKMKLKKKKAEEKITELTEKVSYLTSFYDNSSSEDPVPSSSTTPIYDDNFPALSNPVLTKSWAAAVSCSKSSQPTWIQSQNVTQVFSMPAERRNRDILDVGRISGDIMQQTATHIEINANLDASLTFLITGDEQAVMRAKHLISEMI